jgi:hypothetical protein
MAVKVRIKPSSAMMVPLFLRFQTVGHSMWAIQRSAEIRLENRFRSGGIGELEIVYMHLYPNRMDLVNHY